MNDNQTPLIVSLHMPKTAGISFGAALEEHFGDDLKKDYADYPLNVMPQERHRQAVTGCLATADESAYRQIQCVHGHFLPLKYLLLADLRPTVFVAWMRDPIDRLVSHYHYWFDAYDLNRPDTRPLHRRVVEEKWSLETFCLSQEMRNLYSEYLWGFPLEQFDFVGITENYASDLSVFSRTYLGQELSAQVLNSRLSSTEVGSGMSARLRSKVEQWHAADMELYQRARGASVMRQSDHERAIAR